MQFIFIIAILMSMSSRRLTLSRKVKKYSGAEKNTEHKLSKERRNELNFVAIKQNQKIREI